MRVSPNGKKMPMTNSDDRAEWIHQGLQTSGEFDAEPAANQALTFKTATQMDSEFDPETLHLVSNGQYNNTALLISDQNPYTTEVEIYAGLDTTWVRGEREFTGAMGQQIDDVLRLLDLVNYTQVVITGAPQHQETQDYPTVAIREAVVNAFAHRDYFVQSSVKIEMFADRLEIVSPGGIPDGVTLADIRNELSVARNPRLLRVLETMGYIENFGIGISRMDQAYEQFSKTPQFEIRDNLFKVVLPNQTYVAP